MVFSTYQNGGVNFENLGGRFPEVARNGDPPAWGLLFLTPAWELINIDKNMPWKNVLNSLTDKNMAKKFDEKFCDCTL